MTDDTPAEQDPTRDNLAEEGRRLASQRDDLIASGVDPDDLLVPLHPDDATPEVPEGAASYDGPVDYEPAPFTDEHPDDAAEFDPDHEPTAPVDPTTVVDPEPGEPVLDHDEQPALDDGDPNPDDMAGDFTTPDVDLDFLPTDDGEDQP